MKNIVLTFILAVPILAAAQNVPNGGFENWAFVGASENPEFWITDNTSFYTTVSKDFDPYEGEIAMRVTAQPYPLGLYGEAYTLFEISAIPAALNFYAKWATEFGGVSVDITFLNGETEVYNTYWFGTDSMPEYTLISIPLEQIEPVITHARIKVYALVGDLIAGTAWISVDAMDFGQPMSVQEADKQAIRIYPNPAQDQITLETGGESLDNISIFDIQGRLVHEVNGVGESTRIDVQHLGPGVYTVVGGRYSGRFVVE